MANFLRRKTMDSKKTVTKADLLAFLKGRFNFPPLRAEEKTIETSQIEPSEDADKTSLHLDAVLKLRWGGRTYSFGVEARRLWTPKIISEAIDTVQRHIALGEEGILGKKTKEPLYPLVLVPFLSEGWILKLEAEKVSGIDLCGNGIVIVPGELLVLRTGFPNRFRWEGRIKNVYRKNSSMVARVFLLIRQFNSVNEALAEIQQRGGEVALATVSKVCKSLEDDLVIEGGRGQAPGLRQPAPRRPKDFPKPPRVGPSLFFVRWLRLLQPEKLLDLLVDNYALPAVSRTFQGKCELGSKELRMRLQGWEDRSGARVVLTGASSVEAYAVMAREPVQSFYCSDLDGVVKNLGDDIRETDLFANVRFLETQDDFVYFDRRPGLWASPIQSYLELVAGDKREQETAEQVRRVILEPLAPGSTQR
jgi:hypothetical protein